MTACIRHLADLSKTDGYIIWMPVCKIQGSGNHRVISCPDYRNADTLVARIPVTFTGSFSHAAATVINISVTVCICSKRKHSVSITASIRKMLNIRRFMQYLPTKKHGVSVMLLTVIYFI